MSRIYRLLVLVWALAFLGISGACEFEKIAYGGGGEPKKPLDASELNQRMGRGINLGNALEAPNEGDWGVVLQESYFDSIASAGFQTVRIPVRWSAHSGPGPAFQIDRTFLARVDWAVRQGLQRNLAVIVNMHHYQEIFSNPDAEEAKFLALWKQIAEHYKDKPPTLAFEILNEPHDQLTPVRWNALLRKALAVIRQSNPTRNVLIGPGNWNNLGYLPQLDLPVDDRHIIVTFHYYSPFHFTHQGAGWVQGSSAWLGTRWTGTQQQVLAIEQDFDKVLVWAKQHQRPINLGEFGAYSKAPYGDRVLWTRTVAREAEKRGFSWCYWEFCSGFGIYDPVNHSWRLELLRALIPTGG